MNTSNRIATLAVFLSLTGGIAEQASAAALPRATPESVGLSSDRLKRLDDRIDAAIRDGRSAGGVVVIARKGRLAYEKAYGNADIDSHQPMRTNQYFRLYSMTKPVTAVALLSLFEQGKFQLSDPLSKYLPEFAHVQVYVGEGNDGQPQYAAPKRPITIEDVFRHTAGFVYGVFGDTAVDRAYRTAQIDYGHSESVGDMTRHMASMPLVAQPGTQWIYSYAADVQAHLVEYFSGQPFETYVRQTILDPLNMHDTVFGVPSDRSDRFATLYSPNPQGGLVVTPGGANYERFTAHPFGGAGLSGTPDDYLRFAQMLLDGGTLEGHRILSRKTVEMMSADHLGTISTPWQGYGFGLGVGVLKDPVAYGQLGSAGQFGWSGYATTTVIIDPKESMVAMYFEQVIPEDFALLSDWTNLVYQSIAD
jgi:CubicO group peptidase (beta-lactamase class C family)